MSNVQQSDDASYSESDDDSDNSEHPHPFNHHFRNTWVNRAYLVGETVRVWEGDAFWQARISSVDIKDGDKSWYTVRFIQGGETRTRLFHQHIIGTPRTRTLTLTLTLTLTPHPHVCRTAGAPRPVRTRPNPPRPSQTSVFVILTL